MSVAAKICGLCRPEDARLASEAGADYLGIILAPGPRRREPDEARAIWGDLSGRRVGVFIDPTAKEVIRLAEELRLDVVQLHGSEDPEFCRLVQEAIAGSVWKAVRLRDEGRLASAAGRYSRAVDGVLLEGWSPEGKGGVGARLDWSRLAAARTRLPSGQQLILAGGLNPGNVAAAIRAVGPDVVDVSSGVEAELGVKDPIAVRAFLREAQRTQNDGR